MYLIPKLKGLVEPNLRLHNGLLNSDQPPKTTSKAMRVNLID